MLLAREKVVSYQSNFSISCLTLSIGTSLVVGSILMGTMSRDVSAIVDYFEVFEVVSTHCNSLELIHTSVRVARAT